MKQGKHVVGILVTYQEKWHSFGTFLVGEAR